MLKIYYIIIGIILTSHVTYADGGILGEFYDKEINGNSKSTEDALKTGDIHLDNIPVMIRGAIDFFITIAGTVAIIFIIIGAYKILLGSLEQDKTKGKDTIIMAIGGFALASLAWFIIKLLIDNLSTV